MKDLFEEILYLAGCDNETLIESVSDIKVRNAPNMSVEEFRKVISYDPMLYQYLDLPDNELGHKPNSYLLWLVKHWDNVKNNPSEQVRNLLADFTTLKNRRKLSNSDINSYNSISEIIEVVNSAKQQEDSLTRKQKDARKTSKNADSDIIHLCSGDIYDMYYPKTYGASVKLGKGTRWCTATNSSDKHYKIYSELGPLFVFINKKNPNEKYQLWYAEENDYANELHNQNNSIHNNHLEVLLKDKKIYNYLHTNKQIAPYMKKHWEKEMELPYDEVKNYEEVKTFEDFLKDVEYTQDENGNLIVNGNINLANTLVETLPDNLEIKGDLNLSHTPIASLPDNLKVSGDLNLNFTHITKLPDNLQVGGNLDLLMSWISELPDNLKVGGRLDLMHTYIKSLPNNLQVGGDLNLQNTDIKTLSIDLQVNGKLFLNNLKQLISLPDNFKINGSLYLNGTRILSLPNNLHVGDILSIRDTMITELPNDLYVGRKILVDNVEKMRKRYPERAQYIFC